MREEKHSAETLKASLNKFNIIWTTWGWSLCYVYLVGDGRNTIMFSYIVSW